MNPERRRLIYAAAVAALWPRSAFAAACGPATTRVGPGPFWRAGAPTLGDLRPGASDPGLLVRGRLLDASSCTPLAGRLEVWNADQHGQYDVSYGDGRTFGRASLPVAADGTFEFITVRPKGYGGRPAHIHFMADAGGRRFTTQLYFAGDLRLANDPIGDVHDDLVVREAPVRGRPGVLTECTFDLRIA
jgi:hydroxyquinol 1,2-dioxygenase